MLRAGRITCQNPKADADEPPKCFTFDAVFAPSITQRKLYDVCSAPVVASVLEGFNGTIFAYGQTSSGKTYTMKGTKSDPGVIPRSLAEIYKNINSHLNSKVQTPKATPYKGPPTIKNPPKAMIKISFIEIYNEMIRDL